MRTPFFLVLVQIVLLVAVSCTKEPVIGTNKCSCGDHTTGMYSWEVPKDENCESKKAVNGMLRLFKENERPGVYELLSTQEFDAKEAQRICKEQAAKP